jgi:general secretion pathway protein D
MNHQHFVLQEAVGISFFGKADVHSSRSGMIRIFRLAVVLTMLSLTIPAMCESAASLFDKGRTAEAKMDYETAYKYYLQAWQEKPKDLKYKASMLRTRFLASSSYVHHGQQLRDEGKLDEALADFKKALEIDPASFIAAQELKRTQMMMQQPPQGAAAQPGPLRKLIQGASGPIELKPLSDVPITLKLTEDAKTVYETIGKLAGINVLFDPDYTSRRIHVELNNVTLYDALEVVSMESKTFWRPVTPNTIFVAADTPAKRKELEQNVLKTFYLSNLSQPTELQDLVNTMRTVLEMSRITQLPSQNAIVVRGTPDQVALAEKLVGDLDKARPEVIVEVAIMQIKRDKLRDLGILPPTSVTVALQPNITTTSGTTNPTTGTPTTGGTTGTNTINLNHLGNLTAQDFTVTIPPATASAALSDSDTRLIQNPQIRALDGQKATLKIGDRVPVATGSFGGGLGGLTATSLVQTQFQYIDVGVNVDITPYVHGMREITLKVALDVSAVTGNSTIGGISQPIIGQRKIEHTIRLKEGEVNMLGGIFENNDVKALSGIPGLAQIPIFKYLFSSQHTEHHENEIVFVLIPHIVRGPDVSEENMRPIDIGTANAIELRRSGGPTTAPQTQPQAPQQPGPAAPQRPAQQAPAQQQPPAAQGQGQASPATLMLQPPQATQTVGSQFTVNAVLSGQNVYSVPVQLQYNPNVLQLVNVSNGNFLSQDGQIVTLVHRDDPATGTVQITATRPPNSGGASGQGTVFTLTFLAKAPGNSPVAVTRAGIKDAVMQNVAVTGTKADISVK